MDPHHPSNEDTFAQHQSQHLHPAAHQMHIYQQPHHEANMQQQLPQQQYQNHQQQQMLQQKAIHNQRNTNAIHHHISTQSSQHHIQRTQPLVHNSVPTTSNNNHGQRHMITNQPTTNMNPGQMIRHNRNQTPNQNRANGSQSPYHQQRFPNTHMTSTVNPHHNHLSGGGYPRSGPQDIDFPLRILVQSNMVGAIIGRSGSTIKQIIQQSNARVDVHREDNLDHQEKVISISGSPDSCSAACFKIMEIIQHEKVQAVANDSSGEQESPTKAKQDSLDVSEAILKILAHNNLIGRLIGKNGVSIKKIMDQTSTKINISHNSLTDCTNERIITIVGNVEQVRQAEQIIFSRLRTAYLSDMNVTMQAMSQQQYLFGNVPMSYMPGPYTQNQILSTLVNPQTSHSGHTIPRSMPVNSQGQMAGSPLYPNSPYMNLYQNVPMTPSSHRLLAYHPAMTGLEFEKETVSVYVPNSMVGAIIGKSGSAIKEMINCSGASIKVASLPPSQESAQVQQPKRESNQEQEPVSSAPADNQLETDPNPESNSSEPFEDSQAQPVADQRTRETTRHPNNTESDTTTRKVTIVGSPEAQWSAQCMIFKKVSLENRKSEISLMVEIQVPSKLVGKIIGKGGATIKNIQKQSRVTIRLPDERPNPADELDSDSETSIQIIGEFRNSQMAQRQIRHLIKDNPYRQQRNRPNSGRQDENNEGKDDAQEANYQSQNETKNPVEGEEREQGDVEESAENNKKTQDDNQPNQRASPLHSADVEETQEGEPTIRPSSPHQTSVSDSKSGHESVVISSNNNTIEKNLNLENKLSNNDSSSVESKPKKEDGNDDEDHEAHGKLDGCRVENGENVINSITPCAKQKSISDTSTDEPALINNGK